MANISQIKLPNNVTYDIKDNNALPLTGGSVTGPVSFGDSVTMDEATIGDLVVNGSGSITNNLSVNTINGVEVGSSPKFTDTNTEVSTLTLVAGSTAGTSLTSGGKFTLTAGSKTVSFTMPTIPTVPSNIVNTITTTAGAHTAISSKTGNVSFNVPTTAAHVGAATSDHVHGNITNGGDITATAPTIASGDQIIINDHSASKVTNGPTFDGSTITTALTPKGTWESFLNSSSTLNAAKLSGAIPSAVTATTQTAGNNSTKIATTAYVDSAISGLPTPMQFIGTVGTNGTTTWANLPAAAATNEGYTYKVITDHSAETGKPAAEAGDTIVSNGTEWVVIPSGDETATQSATTGVSIPDHSTTSIYGVSSSTITVTGVSGSTSVYGVKSGTNSTTTASKASGANGTASSWTFEEKTIPNVTAVGSASTWTFEEKSIPNVTAAGSGSLTFTMDSTDTKKLVITHTHTAPTLGTAIKVQSKSGGSNGTAPTFGTAIKVQSKSGGSNGTAPSWSFTDVTVPIRADSATTVPIAAVSATTVPIKNSSATTVVTSETHTVTDNGHTHTI